MFALRELKRNAIDSRLRGFFYNSKIVEKKFEDCDIYEMKVSENKKLCHNIYATNKGKTSINSQLTPQPLH